MGGGSARSELAWEFPRGPRETLHEGIFRGTNFLLGSFSGNIFHGGRYLRHDLQNDQKLSKKQCSFK